MLKELNLFPLENFDAKTLIIDSESLKQNPLGDPSVRYNPVLIPKAANKDLPVVLVLAGFTGNGPKYFSPKGYEQNFPQTLDECVSKGAAPKAIYVFADAWTYWGGSQFINSKGMGSYEDYVMKDLVPAIKSELSVSSKKAEWCVHGGSSGGYGALYLGSRYNDAFGTVSAIAPDSFFELSLLKEIYEAYPSLQKLGGINGVKSLLQQGKLMRRRDSHTLLNAIAMGLCYAPDGQGGVSWPIDDLGRVDQKIWQRWLKHDPVNFLKEQSFSDQQVYLDVGKFDQFHLQFGTRQISNLLNEQKIDHHYSEFDGNHFDIGARRPDFWKWLGNHWN